MLFAAFFASKWRWLAAALAVIFAVLVLSQGLDYASSWLARRRATKTVRATEQAHAERAADEPHQVHHFDSTVYTLVGQHREMVRQAHLLKKQDEALTHSLPAAPALPAEPARQ